MFKTLVISGGASKGILVLGALLYVQEFFTLENFNRYFGTSIGAMLCLLLAVGYEPLEIVFCFRKHNFRPSVMLSSEDVQLVDYDSIISHLEKYVVNKLGKIPTLKEFYTDSKKELFFITYNYSKEREEVLSRHTYPDMSCIDAVKLSCAIPFIFKECKYLDNIYIDGGFVNNFAIENAYDIDDRGILGINISSSKVYQTSGNIITKLNNLMSLSITTHTEYFVRKYSKECCIIDIEYNHAFYKMSLTTKEVLLMLNKGYAVAKAHCSSYFKTDIHLEQGQDEGVSTDGSVMGYLSAQGLDKSEQSLPQE